MKYYIGFTVKSQEESKDILTVVVYGASQENENGLVSRCSAADMEETFDDFQSYSVRLSEFNIEPRELIFPPEASVDIVEETIVVQEFPVFGEIIPEAQDILDDEELEIDSGFID